MVGTNQARDVSLGFRADHRASVPADVVIRAHRAVVVANDDDRVGIHPEREVISGLRNLARVSGEQPAGSPNAFDVASVNCVIAIKLAGQRPTRTALCKQLGAERARGIRSRF